MTASILGQFVWHELMTSDPVGARDFYPAVVGWGVQGWAGDSSYNLWVAGDRPVGGWMALPPEALEGGAQPHWLSYMGTPDVDGTSARVRELGGKVMRAPWDIPQVGRIAVLVDPQGAVFCGYTPTGGPPGPEGEPAIGEFSWHELASTDPAGALAFYGDLFGWKKTGEVDMGPDGAYTLFGTGELPVGGIFRKPAHVPVSNWLPYASVASADRAAEAAMAAGGRVLVPPMEVPGGDRIAVIADPQGAVLGVHARAG